MGITADTAEVVLHVTARCFPQAVRQERQQSRAPIGLLDAISETSDLPGNALRGVQHDLGKQYRTIEHVEQQLALDEHWFGDRVAAT